MKEMSGHAVETSKNCLVPVSCPLCGSGSKSLRHSIEGYTIKNCGDCGMVFLDPRPAEHWIDSLYDGDYFEGKGFDGSVDYKKEYFEAPEAEIRRQRKKLSDILWALERGGRRPSDGAAKPLLLDLGAGCGLFLKTALGMGFSPEGVDVSKDVTTFITREVGCPTHTGTALSVLKKLPTAYADAITMIEVIEHLTDPVAVVSECHRVLKPGGVLYIQTGNIKSPKALMAGASWDYFTLPGHICYFSKKSMARLLRQSAPYSWVSVSPPSPSFRDAKAYRHLRRTRLIDDAGKARGPLGAVAKLAVDGLLSLRELALSPGLVAMAQKEYSAP